MARKRKAVESVEKDDTRSSASKADAELVTRVRRRYSAMFDADEHNRKAGMEDLRFVNEPGAQWDAEMRKYRGERPCYEFNELRLKCKRIINDMRSNRPQGKVLGYEDATKKTADVLEGLCRNRWNVSDGDTIIDAAGEYQVAAGMACWRVTTGYESDRSFDQDVDIEGIKNPFCLYCDPAAKDPLKRDARDWVLTEKIPLSVYKERYADAKPVDFNGLEFDDDEDWGTTGDAEDRMVRIAEYHYKEPLEIELWQLKDGRVVDAADEASQAVKDLVAKKRTVKSHQIMSAIVSGNAVLKQPVVLPGTEHEFVMIHGETIVINGKTFWWGLPRFGKDAQRNLNIAQTAAMESTAQSLQSKYWATAAQAEGMETSWAKAFHENIPVMLYNVDSQAPGPPQRVGGPEVPVAMLQLAQMAHSLVNTTTGIYEASEGAPSNEKSGRALIARQQQGEITTFNYQDNMAKGIQRTWEIMLAKIPKVYDTQRQLRILGADGADDYVKVNEVVPNPNDPNSPLTVHDLTQGKYDATITTGPNFATKRQEATEMYGQLVQSFPQIMGVAGDLIAKSWDLPYADEISERLKTMLPPQIQESMNKDKQQSPEVQQAMMQVQQAMAQVQQHGQLVQAAAQELQQEQATNDKQKAEIQIAIANLKTQQAQFDADVAKQLAQIQMAQMKAQESVAQDMNATERASLDVELKNAVAEIQSLGAQFMQQAVSTMADIQAKQAPVVVVPPRPRIVSSTVTRENGQLKATHQYEGDAPQQPMMPGAMPGNGMPSSPNQ